MARDIDVYQLARSFATRNQLTSIDYPLFARAVQRQAMAGDQSDPLYHMLATNPDVILMPRLFKLAGERRLVVEAAGDEISAIIMPEYYVESFLAEYKRMEESPELAFPDEASLKISVPSEWMQSVNVETDLAHISDLKAEVEVPLYRLVFASVNKPIVVPSTFVPEKLLEYSILKIRFYLRQGANREFIQNKLLYAFASKEAQLKDALTTLLSKPTEAASVLKASADDFVFLFWSYMISHIKRDLDKKSEKTAEDVSLFQAALLCEFYAGFFKAKTKRIQDMEIANRALSLALRKPPFSYSFEEILSLKDSQGLPLMGRLNKSDIEAYLKNKTTQESEGGLPELFVIPMGQGRRCYVAKEKIFTLFFRLISEARNECKSRIVGEWKKLLEDFKSTPAMESDEAFKKELSSIIEQRFALFASLLKERFLFLAYEELAAQSEPAPELSRLFRKTGLLPIEELLDLDRRSLYSDARMLLPFWYSVGLFSAIARLFRRSAAPKKPAPPSPPPVPILPPPKAKADAQQTLKERRGAFSVAANAAAKEILPSDYSIDEYLRLIEERWNTLLNPQAKADLREDVESLIRDYLRGVLRNLSPSAFTVPRIKNLAATLANTPALRKINNHAAIEQYVQVYMIKLLIR